MSTKWKVFNRLLGDFEYMLEGMPEDTIKEFKDFWISEYLEAEEPTLPKFMVKFLGIAKGRGMSLTTALLALTGQDEDKYEDIQEYLADEDNQVNFAHAWYSPSVKVEETGEEVIIDYAPIFDFGGKHAVHD